MGDENISLNKRIGIIFRKTQAGIDASCLPTVILIIEPSQRLQYLNKNPNIVIIFGLWFHVFPVLDIMLLLISFLLRKKCKPKHMWTVRSFIFTNVDINIFLQKEKQILFFFFLHQITISV